MSRETEQAAAEKRFTEADFRTFEKAKQRDELFNEERRRLKGRLKEMGLVVQADLKRCGLALELRTSLSHPYTFNGFKVSSMWFYLSRPETERKALRRILGADLGKDLDPNYLHLVMQLAIDEQGLELGLRINEKAWWDSQNLKAKCEDREQAAAFAKALEPLDGFIMRIHDWKKDYRCGELGWGDVQTFMKYFRPAEHRFSVQRRIPKADPLATSSDLLPEVGRLLGAMIPAYRFIAWSKRNDYLGLGA